ncbi:MAG: hypothetical protein IPJ07_14790 [Acidobacteria bacterium]|nr:hypothetical protein [Acidobacteriota bacterium]
MQQQPSSATIIKDIACHAGMPALPVLKECTNVIITAKHGPTKKETKAGGLIFLLAGIICGFSDALNRRFCEERTYQINFQINLQYSCKNAGTLISYRPGVKKNIHQFMRLYSNKPD